MNIHQTEDGTWDVYDDPYMTIDFTTKEDYEKFEEIILKAKKYKWIPVTEKLPYPEDMNLKLVTCVSKKGVRNVNRAYYMNGCWHGAGSMAGVVAWMDIPEPYMEEDTHDR